MIELILVATYLLFCVIKSKKWIVCSLIILFPCHSVAKSLFESYFGSTFLFPLWYDIAIFTLLFKAFYSPHSRIRYIGAFIIFILMLFMQFSVSFFSIKPDAEAVSTLRLYLHCIALFVSLSIADFDIRDLRQIKKVFIYSALFYCLSGILIYALFQQEFHLLLGHYEFRASGIGFTSPSFQIMGFERMFGLVGAPNQFGVYMGFIVIFLFYVQKYLKENSLFVKMVFALSICCIILSFSRAGWGIVIMTLGILYVIQKSPLHMVVSFVKTSMVLLIAIWLINLFVPEVLDIVVSSFTGEEGSAATRGSIVKSGFSEIADNILGHGLGTGIEENGSPIAESAMVIWLYELGVFFSLYYYGLIVFITIRILKRKAYYSKVIGAFVIATIIASVVSMNPFQYPYIYYFWAVLGVASNNKYVVLNNSRYGKILQES